MLNIKQIKIIEEWIKELVQKETWKNPHDLHIDVVDPLVAKNNWINLSVDTFEKTIEILKRDKLDFIAILSYHLNDLENLPTENTIAYQPTIEDMCISPPSVYIYDRTSELGKDVIQNIKTNSEEGAFHGYKSYHLIEKIKNIDNLYPRFFYVVHE